MGQADHKLQVQQMEMGETGHKCSSWSWVRLVTSVAAGDGPGRSQVTNAAAGDGSGRSQV